MYTYACSALKLQLRCTPEHMCMHNHIAFHMCMAMECGFWPMGRRTCP